MIGQELDSVPRLKPYVVLVCRKISNFITTLSEYEKNKYEINNEQ